MADRLQKQLEALGGYDGPTWYVCAVGGHDRKRVEEEWSLRQLFDSYFDLRMKALLVDS